MPELPEVETVCRGLAAVLDGHVITRLDLRRPDLRFPLPLDLKQRVEGRRVERVRRRAKYILMDLDDGTVIIAHLGMSGRMVVGRLGAAEPLKHDHVVFETDHGMEIRFNDPRRFGFIDLADQTTLAEHPMLTTLGPEPLGNEFNGPVLADRLAGKVTPIKAALLDQRIVAGLGNIYVCEALYFARLSPTRLAATIQGAKAERLVEAIRSVLSRAIEAGGSSLRDYVQTSGELGYFQHQWAVYGKEGQPCPDCHCEQGVERMIQSNRSTFYCAKKQR